MPITEVYVPKSEKQEKRLSSIYVRRRVGAIATAAALVGTGLFVHHMNQTEVVSSHDIHIGSNPDGDIVELNTTLAHDGVDADNVDTVSTGQELAYADLDNNGIVSVELTQNGWGQESLQIVEEQPSETN